MPLLAGAVVFWGGRGWEGSRRGTELRVRGWDLLPGGGEGTILGGKLETGWGGVGVQGLVTQRARVETPGLEGLKASGAGGDNVAWLAAVGAEVGVSPAATFFI